MAKEIPFVEGYVPIEIIEGALNGGMLNFNSPELLHYFEMVSNPLHHGVCSG